MISPTPRQFDLLRYIAGAIEFSGYYPRYKKCADALGLSSKSNISQMMKNLEERGVIRRLSKDTILFLHLPSIPRAPDGSPLFFVGVEP